MSSHPGESEPSPFPRTSRTPLDAAAVDARRLLLPAKMPLRLRMRPQPGPRDISPISARYDFDMPDIEDSDPFRVVVKKLSLLVASSRYPIYHPFTPKELELLCAGGRVYTIESRFTSSTD